MKKLIFGAVTCMLLGLTSCGDTNYCYKVTYKKDGTTVVTYVWTTKNNLDTAVKPLVPEGVRYNTMRINKSQSDCIKANLFIN